MIKHTNPSLPFVVLAVFSTLLLGLVVGSGNAVLIPFLVLPGILAVAILTNFRLGVMFLMLMMPIAATKIMPHQMLGVRGLNPFNVALLGTLFSFGLLMAFRHKSREIHLQWRIFIPLILALALGTFVGMGKINLIPGYYYLTQESLYSTPFEYIRDEFIKPILLMAAVWLISEAVSRSKVPERWLSVVSVSAISLPLMVIVVVLLSGYSLRDLASQTSRSFLTATGLHANQLAVVLLPVFSSALFMLPAQRTILARFFGLMVMGAALIGLMLTFSRAAFLGVLLVAIVFFFLRRQFRYIFLGVVVVCAAALVIPDAVVERATLGFSSGSVGGRTDPLTAGRVGGIWLPLLPEIFRHIVIGDGINATIWSDASRALVVTDGHPHNAYLRLLMDHGLIGGAFVVYFLIQVWQLFRRLKNDEGMQPVVRAYYQGISVSYAVSFVQCISGSRLVFDYTHVFYWFAIGIGLGLERFKLKQSTNGKPANGGTTAEASLTPSPQRERRS